MGGTDDPSNLLKCNIAMHAFLHKCLWEEHGHIEDKLAWLGLLGIVPQQYIIDELNRQPKSEEAKRKMSIAKQGKEPWNKGKKGISEETREKMRLAKLGKKQSQQQIDKRANSIRTTNENRIGDHPLKGKPGPNLGKTLSQETKKKQSEAKKTAWSDPKYRNKMIESHENYEITDEHRKNLSIAITNWWANRK